MKEVPTVHVIIVGLSASGKTLARTLIARKYEVAVIDKDETRCKEFATEVDALIIHGNAEDKDNLINAGIKKAQALVAATNDDSVNLFVTTMAKEFQVPTLIAVLRDPEHRELFQKIGVNTVMPDEIVSEYIDHMLFKIVDFLHVGKGGSEVFTLQVSNNSKAVGKKLREIKLPSGYNTVAVIRREKLITDHSTVIEPEDDVLIYGTKTNNLKSIVDLFIGK